jgi:small subunit ribosomal protein S17
MSAEPEPRGEGARSKDAREAMSDAAAATPHEKQKTGFRRTMTGKVVKAKMKKTVVVECVTHTRDPLYGKYVKSRSRHQAHDEKNEYNVGDEVEITEHRPISRHKRFVVTKLVKKFVEE